MIFDQMFSLIQVLDVIGILQCAFVLVIVVLRAADLRQAYLVLAFFTVLGVGFGLPAMEQPHFAHWDTAAAWLVRAMIPFVSYLLILQVAMQRVPAARHVLVLIVPLIAGVVVGAAVVGGDGCIVAGQCPGFAAFLRTFGVVPGAVVLVLLWAQRDMLWRLREAGFSSDRYWVVLALAGFVALNTGIDAARAAQAFDHGQAVFVRTILGLAFAYLVMTLVFRVEPRSGMLMSGLAARRRLGLTPEERDVADRIQQVMELEKPYQEPDFGRAELARRLGVSLVAVSRVISGAFGKSFREFIYDYRIEEAKRLLRESDLRPSDIAFDVGFDNFDTFIRAFERSAGRSPKDFRVAEAGAENLCAARSRIPRPGAGAGRPRR